MSEDETRKSGLVWTHKYKEGYLHEFWELNEATMLHTKSKVAHNLLMWKQLCKKSSMSEGGCAVGFPFPKDADSKKTRDDGWVYNCYVNEKIETYWSPKLMDAIKQRGGRVMQG
jgi:hypothetical protein